MYSVLPRWWTDRSPALPSEGGLGGVCLPWRDWSRSTALGRDGLPREGGSAWLPGRQQ